MRNSEVLMFFSPKPALVIGFCSIFSGSNNSAHNDWFSEHLSSNFNSSTESLSDGIGPTLTKDDSWESPLVIYDELFINEAGPISTCPCLVLPLGNEVNLNKYVRIPFLRRFIRS